MFLATITETQYKRKWAKERHRMIVSVDSMNSGKMNSYLLRVRQENRCALQMKTLFHRIDDMILTDTIKYSIRLKFKENRSSYLGLSYERTCD